MYFYNYRMLNPTFVPNKEEFGDMGRRVVVSTHSVRYIYL